MMQDEHIPQEDLVLYAMQAMQSHELAAVRLHLEHCAECRQALAEVNGDLALVAMSVEPQPLPEGARARFVERLAADSAQTGKAGAAPVVSIESKEPLRERKHPGRLAAVWVGWLAAAASLLFAFSLEQKVQVLDDQPGAAEASGGRAVYSQCTGSAGSGCADGAVGETGDVEGCEVKTGADRTRGLPGG